MQCAKLHLQERSKCRSSSTNERPKRICQKRLVDPGHDEDPRWMGFDRFHCNDIENYDYIKPNNTGTTIQSREDLYLSVQNLQFQGNTEQCRRPRTCFKYKTLPNNKKHRMFVKQIVEDVEQADRTSELSNYSDVYTKYITNKEESRPSTGKSSIVLYSLNSKENKATQVDLRRPEPKRTHKLEFKSKKAKRNNIKTSVIDDDKNTRDDVEGTKIAFHKNGKRKSLTISRTESPATVQVIRVDVVCNYSASSTMSDYEENKTQSGVNDTQQEDKENLVTNLKKTRFANKYMLTNTVKTLDENVAGGKVTLMCKTFRLTDRSKILSDRTSKYASKN